MPFLSTGPDRAQRKVSERGMGRGLGRPVWGRAGDGKQAWPPSWGLTLRVSSQRIPGKADLPDDIVPAGGWRRSRSWAGLAQSPGPPTSPPSGPLLGG